MFRTGAILIACLCFFRPPLRSQSAIGLPEIAYYQRHSYGAGSQNWAIGQDRQGNLFFANNEGLLCFDGVNWSLHPLPNKSKLRSLAIADDGRIYVGGEDEAGYFFPDTQGRLQYHSLLHRVNAIHRDLTDVWDLAFAEGKVFFRASNKILILQDDSISVHMPSSAQSHWRYMGECNGKVYAQDLHRGLLRFEKGKWKSFAGADRLPPDGLLTGMVALDTGSLLVTTFNHGCFLMDGNGVHSLQTTDLAEIASKNIYRAQLIHGQWLAFATSMGGLYLTDRKGRLVHRFTLQEGLQNLNVRSIFEDDRNNLWVGLDDGIHCIAINNSIKHINPDPANPGDGYACQLYKGQLYMGTSTGLYALPIDPRNDISMQTGKFTKVKNSAGQVWGLAAVNDQLLMGHHEGAYHIRNGTAMPLVEGERTEGFWNFWPVNDDSTGGQIIAGNYTGLYLFEREMDKMVSQGRLPSFIEGSRFVEVEGPGSVIVSHPLKGVFLVRWNEKKETIVKKFGKEDGLCCEVSNAVFRIKGKVVVTNLHGLFEWNATLGRFEPCRRFQPYFSGKHLTYLKEDADGNIWFTENKRVGVLDLQVNKPVIIYFPELHNKLVNGFEHIYPLNDRNILLGAEKGFYVVDYRSYQATRFPLRVNLRSITISNGESDSLYYGGYQGRASWYDDHPIRHAYHSLRISFAGAHFDKQQNTEYSYRLEGQDPQWSGWTRNNIKEYTNLKEGTYTFLVKARNNLGMESAPVSFRFTIRPPWYRHWLALLLYVTLAAGLLAFSYRWQHRKFVRQVQKHEEEQRQLQYLHQLEIDRQEKELIQLRNEKLENDIRNKNSELAATAMHLVQKSSLMNSLRTDLSKMMKQPDSGQSQDEIRKLIRLLTDEARVDEDWKQFSSHFDNVHSDFLKQVKAKHPQLSATDLKLCAYLRMNLSTKEIAQLLNISVRGVEIARYRLRKKLLLPTEVNLVSYFVDFNS